MASAAQAGAAVCLLTNPIWLVKTRLQLQRSSHESLSHEIISKNDVRTNISSNSSCVSSNTGLTKHFGTSHIMQHSQYQQKPYSGFVNALWRIGKEEGLKGYYRGLAPSLVLQTLHGAVQFAVYEELKKVGVEWRRTQRKGTDEEGRGGTIGSAALYYPSSSSSSSSSPPSSSSSSSSSSPAQPKALETTVAAALSKLIASVITYPSQVVRARMQQRPPSMGEYDKGSNTHYYGTQSSDNQNSKISHSSNYLGNAKSNNDHQPAYKSSNSSSLNPYSTSRGTISMMWKHEGIKGFYKGLGPALLRVIPQSAITLVLYEQTLAMLNTAAITDILR
eukprot:CAMPEP_0175053526 /NCGR_PEP_ID=MMETSP0052_2-20121109/8981_1 /TAXON_ID=51329 ORGANISM="Polytomella parva, Strain SAG 63-3" /NCGR_SAMPLE_ID=MMETSP0052_2 /ASSEMBLY_ACC=CAM_ASM_000194 /LENGTH=333 /DNA_ID=CAMNT_0016318085 /DNA_START=368 /DNA_END=1369 /DNA_ORIENTATION=+